MKAIHIYFLIGLFFFSTDLKAQVNLTSTSPTYTENFNTLPNNTLTTNPWTDNSTLASWYSNRTVIIGGSGTITNGGLYSFGPSGNTDRAIGSLGSGSAAPIYGVRIKNNGTTDITSLAISFTGEQWRTANTITNTLAFSYQVSGTAFTSVTSGSYTNYTALNFVSPNIAGGGVAIDGNSTANQAFVSSTLTVNIPAGSEIMLRWSDVDDAGSDHGLAIDDLTVTATFACSPPTAAISGAATICSGGNTNITFTGTANATVTYTVNGGSNQTVTLDGTGNATVNTGALSGNAIYALVSANIGTCSQALTGTVLVTVSPLPTATISGATTICNGYSANITFTGTPNATVTYNINGGGNLTVTLDGTGNAVVSTGALSADATYNLVDVVENTCSQTLSGSAMVTVVPLPTVSISGSGAICSGDNANISFTGTPNATITYNENGVPQTVTLDGTGNAVVNTGALTVTTSYDIVSADNGTCTELITGNATITVSPLPTASISGTTTICDGDNADISFTGTANATITYTINNGPAQTVVLDGSGNATVNTGALNANASYELVDANAGLCSQVLTGNATVTVNPLPTVAISGTTVICSGNSTNIFFTGTPNATVNYTVNGVPQSVMLDGGGSAVVNTGVVTAPTTYALVDVTLNTCSATATGSAVVNVNPAPTASISGNTTITPGNIADVQFTGTPNAVVSYTVNGGPVQTVALDGTGNATVNTGVLYYDAIYTLVNVTLGCTQTVSGSIVVTVNSAFGPIYTYTNALAGTYNFVAANAVGTNLGVMNGAVVSTSGCAFGYTTEEYSSAISYDPATNAAVGMQVTPLNGYRLIITGFSVGVRRDVNGPQSVRLAYSLNNGASWISSGVDEMPNNSTCDDVTTLNWPVTPFQVTDITNGIRFAVFGFDASSMGGQLQILDLVIDGQVIATPLPITLEYFKGTCMNGNLVFDWQVSKEDNISGYSIQYSADGKLFSNVAEQPVSKVESVKKHYRATLSNGADGMYRLASKELTGVEQYSNVVKLKCGNVAETTETIVGATGQTLTVKPGSDFVLNEPVSIQLIDLNGIVVAQYENEACSQVIRKEINVAQGIYVVRLVQGGTVKTFKIYCESQMK